MESFTLVEREIRDGARQVTVIGEADLAVADQLQNALQRATEACSVVLIDLEKCEFIDSTVIAVIVVAHRRHAEAAGNLAVFGANSQVHRILSITGLTENGLVFDRASEAMDHA
jgi:anti-anti-sigma factor